MTQTSKKVDLNESSTYKTDTMGISKVSNNILPGAQ